MFDSLWKRCQHCNTFLTAGTETSRIDDAREDLHYQLHQCCQSTIFFQSFIVTRYNTLMFDSLWKRCQHCNTFLTAGTETSRV
jgi:RNase P subunit RPR2